MCDGIPTSPVTGPWPNYFATEALAAVLEVSTGGNVRIVAAYSAISTKSQNSDPAHSPMTRPVTRSMARKTAASSRKNIKLAVGWSARRAAVIIIKTLMPPQSTDENGVYHTIGRASGRERVVQDG